MVDKAGYDPAFLALGAVAAVAFSVFLLAMPETADPAPTTGPGPSARLQAG
jgi:hypothetical protein